MSCLGLKVLIRTTNPCCDRRVRLNASEGVPKERFDRTCPACGRRWVIERRFVKSIEGGRVDMLEWEVAK